TASARVKGPNVEIETIHFTASPVAITCIPLFFFLRFPPPPRSTLFPYTTLFRSYCSTLHTWPGKLRTTGPVFLLFYLHRRGFRRSEEHTSELQSLAYLVCRLLLEKKNCCCYFLSSVCRLPSRFATAPF